MPGQLRCDPQSKKLIKDTLYEFLYEPVEKAYQKRLDTIIQQNSALLGNHQEWLTFQGDNYHSSKATLPEPRQMNRCHAQMLPLMKEYVQDRNQLNQREVPYVLGYITKVLNSSESLEDYFKLLPESVHAPLKKLQCPCTDPRLKPETIQSIQEQHHDSLLMIKKRMVENLLL